MLPNGISIHRSAKVTGNVPDIIFNTITGDVEDEAHEEELFPGQCSITADKGYQCCFTAKESKWYTINK